MSVKSHLGQSFERYRQAKIMTVDPSQRRVEGVLSEGAMVQIAVFDIPSFFRWPKEGEIWTIYQQGGVWRLGNQLELQTAEHPIENLDAGDTKIKSDVIKTESGFDVFTNDNIADTPLTDNRHVVVTDQGTATNGKALVWNAGASRWDPAQVGTLGLQDSAVSTVKLADASVSTTKLVDASVTTQKLAKVPHGVFTTGSILIANNSFQIAGSGGNNGSWTTTYQYGGFTTSAGGTIHVPVTGWYDYGVYVQWSNASAVGVRYAGLYHISGFGNFIEADTFIPPNGPVGETTGINLHAQSGYTADPVLEGLAIRLWQTTGSNFNCSARVWITYRSDH